jgi:hypothetical protein
MAGLAAGENQPYNKHTKPFFQGRDQGRNWLIYRYDLIYMNDYNGQV